MIVLGGSASTLGNMNRPIIPVKATQPAVNAVQPTATQEMKRLPIMKPRRSVWPAGAGAGAAATFLAGLGRTDCGFAAAGLAATAGFAGAASAALAAASLVFLAPA